MFLDDCLQFFCKSGKFILYRFDLKNQERLNLVNPPDPPCQGGKQLS